MYCIYTNKDVSENKGNLDHIIPLSLGGKNEFVVWSDEEANSKYGSKVDGALVNDPLVQFALRDAGVKGHSGRKTEPLWRNVTVDEQRLQVTWAREEVRVWDSKGREYLKESDFAGKPMEVKLKIDMFVAARFLAKVALGAGYFIYEDLFRSNAECDALRLLSSLDPEKDRESDVLKNSTIRVCDRFHTDSMNNGPAVLYRALCEGTKRTILIAIPTQNSVSFHVGIVGMYIGSIDIPADTGAYPIGGDHDLGHTIVLGPGEMERLSLRELAGSFYRSTTGREPPELE